MVLLRLLLIVGRGILEFRAALRLDVTWKGMMAKQALDGAGREQPRLDCPVLRVSD